MSIFCGKTDHNITTTILWSVVSGQNEVLNADQRFKSYEKKHCMFFKNIIGLMKNSLMRLMIFAVNVSVIIAVGTNCRHRLKFGRKAK